MSKMQIVSEYSRNDGKIAFVERFTERAERNINYELNSHHEEWEVYWFLEGDLYFAFEGEKYDVEPGGMIIVGKRLLHRPIIKTPCRYRRRIIRFTEDVFIALEAGGIQLKKVLEAKGILVFGKEEFESSGLSQFYNEIESFLSRGTEYDDFCASVSLIRLLIVAAERYKPPVENNKAEKLVRDIILYIDRNLDKDLEYKTLAAEFFVSEKNLYRVFKKETGFSLSKYVKERRIIKAKQILSDGGSSYEAALGAGFKDYSVFFRSFKNITGYAPSEFSKNKICR